LKAVFGLGNPGLKYALTPHNVGFAVIDLYRRQHLRRARGRLVCSSLVYRTPDLLLVKPMTFMNASGEAVRKVIDRFHIALSDALVVYDDLDLPIGALRVLPKGGAGTHKGMLSILSVLGTEEIPRLRVGTDVPSRPADTVDYVLGKFSEAAWTAIFPVLEQSAEAIEAFRTNPLDTVMNRFNRRGPGLVNDP
jgi:peptidyl-tRNA hydrolase, PTH1 family